MRNPEIIGRDGDDFKICQFNRTDNAGGNAPAERNAYRNTSIPAYLLARRYKWNYRQNGSYLRRKRCFLCQHESQPFLLCGIFEHNKLVHKSLATVLKNWISICCCCILYLCFSRGSKKNRKIYINSNVIKLTVGFLPIEKIFWFWTKKIFKSLHYIIILSLKIIEPVISSLINMNQKKKNS